MPYTLNIRINGTRITDEAAKIISLYNMALGNAEVSEILLMKENRIHKEVSALYNLFDLCRCVSSIMVISQANGFNHYGQVCGRNVLDENEQRRLSKHRLLLHQYPVMLHIQQSPR